MSRTLTVTLAVLGFAVVVVGGLWAVDRHEAKVIREAKARRATQLRHPSHVFPPTEFLPSGKPIAGPFLAWERDGWNTTAPYDHRKQGL